MLTDVTALVVTHDSAEVVGPCLAALAAVGVPALVVDNASRDGSAELAERAGASVLRLASNEGYGRANNAGARAATSEFVLVVNPDVVLETDAVAALIEAAGRYPEAVLLAPRLVEPDGRLFFQPRSLLAPGRADAVLPSGDCCAPFLSGACLLVRREPFLRAGGFDERIFLFYEDDDLCRRLSDGGAALVHVHGAVARHARGASSCPARGRVFNARWHQAWSRIYVSRKYRLPSPILHLLAVNGPKALAACLLGRRALVERYGGTVLGALAGWRGRGALARQGLEDPS